MLAALSLLLLLTGCWDSRQIEKLSIAIGLALGIGLSIVKRILTLHHADMTIRNDQTGVCYSISVPRN